ncbi:Sir2 family NAD-dependent protein deacetylase [Nocardia sp. NPDC003183]
MTTQLVAILSGAGVSTDSGIPDYRGPAGLWQRDSDAQKLVTYDYCIALPALLATLAATKAEHSG